MHHMRSSGDKKVKPRPLGPAPFHPHFEASQLVSKVLESCQSSQLDQAANLICGALKSLSNTKCKPDLVLTVGLIYLAKLKPELFASESVTQALMAALLRKDPMRYFKGSAVAVLAANLLAHGYSRKAAWPSSFLNLYVQDAMGERVWVDHPECRDFVNILIAGLGTHINLLLPDMGPVAGPRRADSPLPLTITLDDDGEGSPPFITITLDDDGEGNPLTITLDDGDDGDGSPHQQWSPVQIPPEPNFSSLPRLR